MSEPTKNLATRTFAHLLGRPAAAKADEDDNKKKDDMAEKEKEEEKAEDKEKDKCESDDDKKDAAADNEDDKEKASDDEDEDDKKKEDEERAELNGSSSASVARNRERDRCAAIFGSKHSSGRIATACHLAFNTRMTAKEVIGVLASVPAEAAKSSVRTGLSAAMDKAPNPRQVATTAPEAAATNSSNVLAQQIIDAGKYRRGEK